MRRAFFIACFIGSVLLLSFAAFYYGAGKNKTTFRIVIKEGASFYTITQTLTPVLHNPTLFRLFGRTRATRLHAGEYDIPAHASPAQILDQLENGKIVLHPITLAEGLTSSQITQLLINDSRLSGVVATPLEGTLLPETYHIARHTARADILARMQNSQKELLAMLWKNRAPDLPIKTPREAVIIASLIEAETSLAEERALVAAVFYNRLRRNMRLESDPTTIYGITQGKTTFNRALTRADLSRKTSHNTYRMKGLPPTPINNPGTASLRAALHPAKSDALYFVADGKGGHRFAVTFTEHQKNVRAYRQARN